MKATSGFRKFLTFLVFVLVASLFWFILALNDDIQDDFEVGIKVVNVPDSVTFIQEIPKEIHVLVRDKGTSLWRNAMFTRPEVEFNFREYASDGLFYVSRGELTSEVKKKFGQSANVISVSLDTIGVIYTTLPPRRVPVEVNMDITPAMGKVISSKPVVEPGGVQIYSSREGLDTITRVVTDKLRAQNLEEPTTFTVKLKKIPGVRIEPSEVKVRVNVEALIRRQITVPIQIDNVPAGEDLLLFPSTAKVEYYIPMSKFGSEDHNIEVRVNYRDVENGMKNLPLNLGRHSKDLENVRILDSSVEYTLVQN
ncbi:MAG: hypothetical protein K2H35_04780 [Muribaculaceae bacterium]|nr:hypothetical protein [Muribaculaceae bacterium]